MDRTYYLDLAAKGLRTPIAADLFLHQKPNPEACRFDGKCLGRAIVETANHFQTPLAFPLMDLQIEKEWLLTGLGIDGKDIDAYHFDIGKIDKVICLKFPTYFHF